MQSGVCWQITSSCMVPSTLVCNMHTTPKVKYRSCTRSAEVDLGRCHFWKIWALAETLLRHQGYSRAVLGVTVTWQMNISSSMKFRYVYPSTLIFTIVIRHSQGMAQSQLQDYAQHTSIASIVIYNQDFFWSDVVQRTRPYDHNPLSTIWFAYFFSFGNT